MEPLQSSDYSAIIKQSSARTSEVGHYPKDGTLTLYDNHRFEFICPEDTSKNFSFMSDEVKKANIAVSGSVAFDLASGNTVTLSYGNLPGGTAAVAGGELIGGAIGSVASGVGVGSAISGYGQSFKIGDEWKPIIIDCLGIQRVQTKSRTQLIVAIVAITLFLLVGLFGFILR
jgi:hypothetical protein